MNNNLSVPPGRIKSPVLFLVFNRINSTKQVFESIRMAKPPKIYLASDGPRASSLGEKEKVYAIRDYIVANIDWDCELKTLFRDRNLGCKEAVSGAIDWFFDNEEMGIILEDDCLPNQSFFLFCEELLEKYKYDERVFMICGTNKAGEWRSEKQSYHFSLCGIWGWASWARAWKHYDVNMLLWKDKDIRKAIKVLLGNHLYWVMANNYKAVYSNQLNTWDYQWEFCSIIQSGLTIIPSYNLVSNIGFDYVGTNMAKNPYKKNLKMYDMKFPLKHPDTIMLDKKYVYYDYFSSKKLYHYLTSHIPFRLRSSIKKIWNKLKHK